MLNKPIIDAKIARAFIAVLILVASMTACAHAGELEMSAFNDGETLLYISPEVDGDVGESNGYCFLMEFDSNHLQRLQLWKFSVGGLPEPMPIRAQFSEVLVEDGVAQLVRNQLWGATLAGKPEFIAATTEKKDKILKLFHDLDEKGLSEREENRSGMVSAIKELELPMMFDALLALAGRKPGNEHFQMVQLTRTLEASPEVSTMVDTLLEDPPTTSEGSRSR